MTGLDDEAVLRLSPAVAGPPEPKRYYAGLLRRELLVNLPGGGAWHLRFTDLPVLLVAGRHS
jgi:hypothetical protein